MSGQEFRKLWREFDASGDGRINYTEFNNKVGGMILPFGAGLQLNRPETPKMREWQKQALAKGIQKKIKDIEAAFKEIDTDGSGRISQAEFIQALRRVGLAKVGDAESYQMMQKHRRATNNTGEMTLEEFKDCMNEYLRIPTGLDAGGPAEKPSAALASAEAAVERTLPKSAAAIIAFFAPADPHGRGEVDYDGFRAGLEAAGVRLTEPQFLALCYKLDAVDDGIIAYKDFAVMVCGGEAPSGAGGAGASTLDLLKNWVEAGIRPGLDVITGKPMDKDAAAKKAAVKMGLSEMELRLAHALVGRRAELKAAFAKHDAAHGGRGSLPRAELAHMLEVLEVPVNDDLLSTLFQKYDKAA